MVQKVSRWSGKFLNVPESFLIFSRWSRKFLDSLENDLRTLLVANTINAYFFVAKMIWSHFFVTKTICAHFFVAKMIYAFFCRENDLRTSSGKFLRVESYHPQSSHFLGLWFMQTFTLVINISNDFEWMFAFFQHISNWAILNSFISMGLWQWWIIHYLAEYIWASWLVGSVFVASSKNPKVKLSLKIHEQELKVKVYFLER